MNNLPLPPRIIGRVRAIYSYYSEEQSSLNFKKGDSIDVLTKLDSGWWDGWCHGERGWFPSNYVQEDTPEEDMYTPHEAHLPDGWTIQMAEDGHTRYYYNQQTGQMSCELPTTITTTATKEEHIIEHRRDYRESFFRPKQPIETKEEEEEHQPTEAELMDNWVERQTPQGRVYFCNLITQETTWDYNEIDTETGRLTVETNETQKNEEEEEDVYFRDAVQEQSIPQELTWNKIASDIAFGIHELSTVTTKKQRDQVQPKTLSIVESIRLMLYASRTLDKDSLLLQEPIFREPRRAITSTLSKLVLDTKLSGDLYDSAWTSLMFEKIQRDANELMVSVRNFVSLCQQREVDISHICPRFIQPSDIPAIEPVSPVPSLTTGMAHLGIGPEDRQRVNKATNDNSLNQKTRYLLNQDLVVSLQVYSHQIYTSAEELSTTAQNLLTLFQQLSGTGIEERTSLVGLFKTLSNQIGQYIAILDNINFDSNPNPSMVDYKISRQNIYSAIGHLFGAVQALTDLEVDLPLAIQKLDEAVIHIENVIETVEQSVIAMVNERKHSMGREDEKENEAEFGGFDDGKLALRRPTMGMVGISDIVNRRRQQSIRPDDRTIDSTDTLGYDHSPDEIDVAQDNTIKGGTLAALVERLTAHNTSDTNFIATFLLTYRSFCTSEELATLLENRYNLRPPERLTPDQLVLWTERKQKLVRLRVFNVIKNWLENYYIDEDEPLLSRFEYFTKSYIQDSSEFAAKQILNLIKKRQDSGGEMKKIVPTTTVGPEPIVPKNMDNIKLSDTDSVEMARQLSVLDFKLYSSIRPIECLGKAWSKDGDRGSVAVNIKQSIRYCNRLTSWVTESILAHDEPKKRATVIKYWVHVAEQCRIFNNFNTCMAILSAFDNSAIGRLKKTWMMCNRNTTQTLASIRKLLGANRNFTEYREIIHSLNPPCIPFLGIYLQDLTFIEDGNPDFLRKSNHLINFAKRQKVADVIRELKQFQNFAYNFITIPELQQFIQTQLDYDHDTEELYERSLQLEPRVTDTLPSIYLAGNVM